MLRPVVFEVEEQDLPRGDPLRPAQGGYALHRAALGMARQTEKIAVYIRRIRVNLPGGLFYHVTPGPEWRVQRPRFDSFFKGDWRAGANAQFGFAPGRRISGNWYSGSVTRNVGPLLKLAAQGFDLGIGIRHILQRLLVEGFDSFVQLISSHRGKDSIRLRLR